MTENNSQSHETSRKASSKFWKRCFQLALIMVLPICFLVWICLFRDVPLEISKETTYITEPLTADGKRVDYFRAMELELYPPTMKTDDNGYRLIVRALGPSPETAPELAPQIYEKLGLDPNIPPTMKYEESWDFLKRFVESQPTKEDEETTETTTNEEDIWEQTPQEKDASGLDAKTGRPWTLKELPMMADWLDQNGPALDILGQAVRKPTFCYPMARKNDQELLFYLALQEIRPMRGFARGLSVRARYRIGIGDIDGAIEDIVTCKTLGRQIGQQGFLVGALVGIAIEGIADSLDIAGSLEHQPTKTQLERLVKELENLPPRVKYEESVRWERYSSLDTLQHIAHAENNDIGALLFDSSAVQTTNKIINIIGFDWNTVMYRFNRYYDDLTQVEELNRSLGSSTIPPYLSPAMLLPTSRSEILADTFASLLLPAIDATQKAFHRAECVDHVQRITLAMLIYEKQHGRLPPAYTVDKEGKPLHGWRVLLLPYLGEEAKKLHAKIKLDEPWDSKHNRKFHAAAIEFYQCPSAELKPGETTYSVVVGKKTAFQTGEGKKLEEFGPNSARMILVLESDTPGCWMNPTFDLTESNAEDALKSDVHSGVIITGLRSGSVSSVSDSVTPENFQKAIEGTATDWENEF